MQTSECIFCKIIQKKITSEIIAETPLVIAIKDIHPKAPTHILIMPKKHITSMAEITTEDQNIAYAMFEMTKQLAAQLTEPKAFNIICNNGEQAGQSVCHLHWHFLAGKNIYGGNFEL